MHLPDGWILLTRRFQFYYRHNEDCLHACLQVPTTTPRRSRSLILLCVQRMCVCTHTAAATAALLSCPVTTYNARPDASKIEFPAALLVRSFDQQTWWLHFDYTGGTGSHSIDSLLLLATNCKSSSSSTKELLLLFLEIIHWDLWGSL